jgi:hypothetical protein
MGHKMFKPHHTILLLLSRIEKVLALLNNTMLDGESFPMEIYNSLYRIYISIHYTAPEVIGNRNKEFGCECFKHIEVLKKFNVDEKIQNIMQGKDM